MQSIDTTSFESLKAKAVLLFQKNRRIQSPLFGEIRISPEGFEHIEWKNKNHKRAQKEAFVRYLCFMHMPYILERSHLYQEFREESQDIYIKKQGVKKKINKVVSCYGFVAVVNNNKNRVKVVVKKVDGWNHYEYVSVIPVWKSSGYSGGLFFDEDMSWIEGIH